MLWRIDEREKVQNFVPSAKILCLDMQSLYGTHATRVRLKEFMRMFAPINSSSLVTAHNCNTGQKLKCGMFVRVILFIPKCYCPQFGSKAKLSHRHTLLADLNDR